MRYKVIATCRNYLTGELLQPGTEFAPDCKEQAARLVRAGCLELIKETKVEAPRPSRKLTRKRKADEVNKDTDA